MSLVLNALLANPAVWSKTALFLMYDENDGWLDHVPPPIAPAGTPGEYLTASPSSILEPSHSSEGRFGVEVPNVSAWRQATVGDLTSTLSATPNTSVPALAAPPVPPSCRAGAAAPSRRTTSKVAYNRLAYTRPD